VPLPALAGFLDFPERPDETGAKADRNQHETKCLIARGLNHEISNANKIQVDAKGRHHGPGQGMLIAGNGPVGRIETSVGCVCVNTASKISAIKKA